MKLLARLSCICHVFVVYLSRAFVCLSCICRMFVICLSRTCHLFCVFTLSDVPVIINDVPVTINDVAVIFVFHESQS